MCLPAAALIAMMPSLGAAGSGLFGASMAATIATGSQLALTGMGAVGAYNSAKASQQQAQYAGQVAQNNATLADQQAADARARGDEEASKVRRDGEQLKGLQRNRMAASGLDLSAGTAAEVVDQTDFFSLTDQATAKKNAGREAWTKTQQGNQFRSDAKMNRATAKGTSPGMAAATSLLGGAGRVADTFYK